MKKKVGLMVILAIMLVFGMTVVGCGTFAGEVAWAAAEGLTRIQPVERPNN
jgi:hypothetical protein